MSEVLDGLPGANDGEAETAPFAETLADLLLKPELMAPPRPVIPRFVYESRLTLLAGTWKSGKSTMLRDAVAAVSTGRRFLGEFVNPARVLWAALDEPLSDAVRGLAAAVPDPANILMVAPPCSSAQLIALAVEHSVDAVVVDTLSDLAATEVESENDAMQVKRFLAPWRTAARQHAFGVVFSHHTGKQSNRSRGSGAIDAMADLILTMTVPADDPTVRKVEAKGRVAVEDFTLSWGETGFELADKEATPMAQVRQFLFARPGASKRAVADYVPRQGAVVFAAINALLATGEVVNLGSANRSELYLAEEAGKRSGKRSGITPGSAGESPGSGREAVPEARVLPSPVGGSTSRGSTGSTLEEAA